MRILAAFALLVGLSACIDATDGGPQAPPNPQGPFRHFVTNVIVPTSATWSQNSLDIDGKVPGGADNALGRAFSDAEQFGITDCGVEPSLFLLDSIQSADLENADAGWHIYQAEPSAQPPRFDGTDAFDVDPAGPSFLGHRAAYLPGKIIGEHFDGGRGTLPLELPVGCNHVMRLDLIGARIETYLSESSCTYATLGGGIPLAEIQKT